MVRPPEAVQLSYNFPGCPAVCMFASPKQSIPASICSSSIIPVSRSPKLLWTVLYLHGSEIRAIAPCSWDNGFVVEGTK